VRLAHTERPCLATRPINAVITFYIRQSVDARRRNTHYIFFLTLRVLYLNMLFLAIKFSTYARRRAVDSPDRRQVHGTSLPAVCRIRPFGLGDTGPIVPHKNYIVIIHLSRERFTFCKTNLKRERIWKLISFSDEAKY